MEIMRTDTKAESSSRSQKSDTMLVIVSKPEDQIFQQK